jgi:hypothetical protein
MYGYIVENHVIKQLLPEQPFVYNYTIIYSEKNNVLLLE